MRAEKAWPVSDHCAKERPQPRDAHLTEHPFPAQSDPQVGFARSYNRRHHPISTGAGDALSRRHGRLRDMRFAKSVAIAANFAKLPWGSSSYTSGSVMQRQPLRPP